MLTRTFLRLAILLALHQAIIAQAQEPTTQPSPGQHAARISFLPPPLDGTITLGIYDQKEKLVRVLYREADIDEFNVGSDALTATWDGKDDAGNDLATGKYTAHGFVVGDLGIKANGFYFNDFVTNPDSPRVRHLKGVRLQGDELHVDAELANDQHATLICEPKQGALLRIVPLEEVTHCEQKQSLPDASRVIDCDLGVNETIWLIDTAEDGTRREIKQLSKTHEVLRRLPIPEDAPQSQAIAASTIDEQIYLVEESPVSGVNRLRALRPPETKTEGDNSENADWKTNFQKQIIEHRNFSIENGKPIPNNPTNKTQSEKVAVKLQPNPLLADVRSTIELGVGFDENGGFLKTKDRLPLSTISETPKLTRGLLIAHGPNALDVFLDDGAVVEQVRVTGVDQMMGFDCGGFELK